MAADSKIKHNDIVFKHFKTYMISGIYIDKIRRMAAVMPTFVFACNIYNNFFYIGLYCG